VTARWGHGPIGVLLGGLLAGWALLARPAAPGGPAVAGMVVAGILAWWAGTLLSRVHPTLPGGAVGVVGVVTALAGGSALLSGAAVAPPLGYANANAALLTAGVAGFLSAAGHAIGSRRRRFVLGAIALSVVAVATTSRAAGVCCVILLAVWPHLRRSRARVWQLASSVTVIAAVVVTAWLGAAHSPQRPDVLEASLSPTRTDLWSDAVHMALREPLLGVGAGNFVEQSNVVRADPDLPAAHSQPLQLLAELGFVGLALLGALFCWMVLSLGRGSVLLAVLALQPTVDYVLEFPAVVVASAVVLGGVAASGMGKPGFTPPEP
jgi:O-antigen ligase